MSSFNQIQTACGALGYFNGENYLKDEDCESSLCAEKRFGKTNRFDLFRRFENFASRFEIRKRTERWTNPDARIENHRKRFDSDFDKFQEKNQRQINSFLLKVSFSFRCENEENLSIFFSGFSLT